MKYQLFSFLILLIIVSCIKKNDTESQFVIEGKFKNSNGEKVLLSELTINGFKTIDSVKVNPAGEFRFRYKPSEKSIYTIQMNKDAIQLILDKGDSVLLEGDFEDISGTYTTFGSAGTKFIEKFRKQTDENFQKANALLDFNKECQELPRYPEIKDSIDNELHKIFLDQQNYVKENIQLNLDKFSALFAFYIYQKFGNLEIFSEDEKLRYSEMLDSSLLPNYSNNSHLIEHHERVVKMKKAIIEEKLIEEKLEVGKIIPDIELNDTSGKPLKLSSLRGKIVYLTFWSASCGKCRQENLKLSRIYDKYKDKGFEIYSVFIGPSKELWNAALKVDKIKWIQVSDLNPQSSIIKIFNLPDDIYRTFLLDEKGAIIAQNPGIEQLEKLLKTERK